MNVRILIIVQLILMTCLNYISYKDGRREGYSDGYMDGVKGVGNAINSAYKFKEVETKPRWTPGIIKQDEDGNYLVEYDTGLIDVAYFYTDIGDWGSRIYGHATWQIVAWMELPEPFEKQEKI